MALSGLDIYKLLPKTNCKQCGFATCLAFAMQLAKKAVSIDKCSFLTDEAKRTLEESSLPPIKAVTIGVGEDKLEIGNETVLFRHEAKFFNPCGIGFLLSDKESDKEIKEKLAQINSFKFERVGQKLNVNLVAIRNDAPAGRFLEAVKLINNNTSLPLCLIADDPDLLLQAAEITKDKMPLIYCTAQDKTAQAAKIANDAKLPLVAQENNLEKISLLTKELSGIGAENLVIDTGDKPIAEKIWDLTQIRRLALKKSNRSFGYPVLAVTKKTDPYEEAIEAATYISKYAAIVLLKNILSWEVLSLLTLRQNIYSDPQKPLQIEPNVYAIGSVDEKSPVLVTTNFSLSYYTVLGEVEASKVPTYILSVDTEGMSVLTAWAAEKFTPAKITQSLDKFNVKNKVKHNQLVIPGYVAVMSGDLEEESGWKITVGPKEAAGIPSFLKNL